MDEIDLKILKILQSDARISISEISNQINLSISSVRNRIKKLENTGVIKSYTAILDKRLLNKSLIVQIFIGVNKWEYTEQLLEFLKNRIEVVECYSITGDYAYSIKVITENTFTLENFLNDLKQLKAVYRIKTLVVLAELKDEPCFVLE